MRTISEANPIVVMVKGCPFLAPLSQGDDSYPSLQHYTPPPPASLFPPFPFFLHFLKLFFPLPCVFTLSVATSTFCFISFPPLSLLDYPLSPLLFPLYFPLFLITFQGTHFSRNALSKGRIIQGTHCPRDRTSESLFVVTSGHSSIGFFSSRPNWDPSLPHPQASGSTPFGSGGGTHSLAGKGWGGPHSDEGTDTLVIFRYIRVCTL